ncbi:acyltransferase [Clostridium perfringens]|nr:acyltransferase [Clostridium perfringens]
MKKIIKYIGSFLRIFLLKIRYLKSFHISLGIRKNTISYLGRNLNVQLKSGTSLEIDENVTIEDNVFINCEAGSIKINEGVYINSNCRIVSLERITIGKNTILGPNVQIYDHNHIFKDNKIPISHQGYTAQEIVIGENVWIGTNSVITEGINICDFVVIGANSVVTKDILISGVYCGAPAKLIKRISEDDSL